MPSKLKDEYVSNKSLEEPSTKEQKQKSDHDEFIDGMKNLGQGTLQVGRGLWQVSTVAASLVTYFALSDISKQRQKNEDEIIDLNKEVLQFLSDHCAKQFDVPKETAEKHLKNVLDGNDTLKNTPLENLFRVELAITKGGKNGEFSLYYQLILLLVKDGQVVRQTITLPISGCWDFAPDDLRKMFIEQDKNELLFLIYTV
ncbi:MAG: hypothetical protein LBJ67_06715 [Planctomycetaceae bacterium]|jgi:hypothetical protein|nr:hypothetical protein [Planctomycetaceae bacterium]